MRNTSDIQITLDLRNFCLDDEALEKLTESLRSKNFDLDELEDVRYDPNLPKWSKALDAVLVGLLTAEMNTKNIKTLFGFSNNYLGNEPSTMEGEANGKKLKVQASSQQDLWIAVQVASPQEA